MKGEAAAPSSSNTSSESLSRSSSKCSSDKRSSEGGRGEFANPTSPELLSADRPSAEDPEFSEGRNTAAGAAHLSEGSSSNSSRNHGSSEAACAYCGATSPECILRCCCCEKYFCNSPCSSSGSMGSHITFHLVRSKHREVMLHPEGPLGDCTLECFQCGSRNIFLLGLIPAEHEGVVVLICREPCLSSTLLKQSGWDLSQWQPLIEGRCFLPWLVRPLTSKEQRKCRVVSLQQLHKLEDLWARNPKASLEELDENREEASLPAVKLSYEDGFEYQRTFAPLVQAEADFDKQMKETQKLENIEIRWDLGLNRKRVACFLFARDEGCDVRLAAGDDVKISTYVPKAYAIATAATCTASGLKNRNACNSAHSSVLSACPAAGAGFTGSSASKAVGLFASSTAIPATTGSTTTNAFNCGSSAELAHHHSVNNSSTTSSNSSSSSSCGGGGGEDLVPWSCVGSITRLTQDSEEVLVEIKKPPNAPGAWDCPFALRYTVEFIWINTSFERMQAALRQLAVDEISVSSYLYHTLMGKHVQRQIVQTPMPAQISAPNLATLNPSQMLAIRYALQHPLSLIQGPPGTGKTLTSSTLVYQMVKQSEASHANKTFSFNKEGGQVLVAAPSNVAVDQLAERIYRTGVKVIRVYSKTREFAANSATSAFCLEHLALHKKITELKTPLSEEILKYMKLKEKAGELAPADERRLRTLIARAEMEVLQTADVICTTCVGAGDNRLQAFRFRQLVIDEAAQATEPECLIPIVLGAKQLVLVGDHCQLGPTILSKKAAAAGLGTSLFSRLLALGHRPLRLKVQYRMHPSLSFFPSFFFYDGELQNGVSIKDRSFQSLKKKPRESPLEKGAATASVDFPWPSQERPMFFYHSTASEEISGSGTSYVNRVEAGNIEKIVTFLLRCGLKASQIGVITPYNGQRAHITSIFQRQTTLGQAAFADLEIASVDAFQGREKDFIILSCVRSNSTFGIGFLADARRLNVAITRAKYGLIICGNATVLANYTPPLPRLHAGMNNSSALLLQQQQGEAKTVDGPDTAAITTAATTGNSMVVVSEPPIWRLLIHHYMRYNLVVDGPLSNLKPSRIQLQVNSLAPFFGNSSTQSGALGGTGTNNIHFNSTATAGKLGKKGAVFSTNDNAAGSLSLRGNAAALSGTRRGGAPNKKGTTRNELAYEELQDYNRSLPQHFSEKKCASEALGIPAAAAAAAALFPSPACTALLAAEKGFQPLSSDIASSVLLGCGVGGAGAGPASTAFGQVGVSAEVFACDDSSSCSSYPVLHHNHAAEPISSTTTAPVVVMAATGGPKGSPSSSRGGGVVLGGSLGGSPPSSAAFLGDPKRAHSLLMQQQQDVFAHADEDLAEDYSAFYNDRLEASTSSRGKAAQGFSSSSQFLSASLEEATASLWKTGQGTHNNKANDPKGNNETSVTSNAAAGGSDDDGLEAQLRNLHLKNQALLLTSPNAFALHGAVGAASAPQNLRVENAACDSTSAVAMHLQKPSTTAVAFSAAANRSLPRQQQQPLSGQALQQLAPVPSTPLSQTVEQVDDDTTTFIGSQVGF